MAASGKSPLAKSRQMKRSIDRVLTTHVGSLIRPQPLQAFLRAKQAGKTFEPVTYEDAGHGFMRGGEAPDAKAGDKKARDEAWKRWLAALKKL